MISAKTKTFLVTKIYLETLSNMLTTQTEKFQKFEIKFHAGISSNTWQTKIGKNQVYCEDHCRRSPRACSHAH
jgi:hypothetical protein